MWKMGVMPNQLLLGKRQRVKYFVVDKSRAQAGKTHGF